MGESILIDELYLAEILCKEKRKNKTAADKIFNKLSFLNLHY